MSSRTFSRLALGLPLAVPALVAVLVHGFGVDPGDGWLGKIAQILLASLLYGGIPYAGLALWAGWRIGRRSEADVTRLMLRAPLLMAAWFAAFALVAGVMVGAPGPFAAVAVLGAIASIVLGYVYILVVLVGRRLCTGASGSDGRT